jgi:nicotinamidase-related amidase
MIQALIIIDVQNDYFTGGNMELVGMEAAADNCELLLSRFREKRAPVFHIQHLSIRPGSSFFVPDTAGCEINPRVKPQADEPVLQKNFPNAFRSTELNERLQAAGIEQLIVCGAMSHMCIDTSVRAAFDLGYNSQLIHDACATRDLQFEDRIVPAAMVQDAFMASVNGLFAAVSSTREYLDGQGQVKRALKS